MSDSQQTNIDAEHLFVERRARLLSNVTAPQRTVGVTIPASGWTQSYAGTSYRIPFRAEGPSAVQRSMPMREILVRLLVPLLDVVMKHHRHCDTALSDVIDRKLFRWLAMEVLIRTQKELHRLDLKSAIAPDSWASVRLSAVRRAVFGSHPPPAHDFFSLYHSNITKREPVSASMELVAPMCDAYNAALGGIVCPPPRATLDEVVLHHPFAAYASKKHNASGPEFLLLSGPIVGSDENIHFHIRGRDWGAGQGPNMRCVCERRAAAVGRGMCGGGGAATGGAHCAAGIADLLPLCKIYSSIVKEFCGVVWKAAVPLEDRPFVVMDSRFLSAGALKWLLEARRGPFIATINRAWHSQTEGAFTRIVPQACGSTTLFRGSQMLFEDRDQPPPCVPLSFPSSDEADERAAAAIVARPSASAAAATESSQTAAAGAKSSEFVRMNSTNDDLCFLSTSMSAADPPVKKRRGRPPKNALVSAAAAAASSAPTIMADAEANRKESATSSTPGAGRARSKFRRGRKPAAKASTEAAANKDAASFRELNVIASGNALVSGKRTRIATVKPRYTESSSEDEGVEEPAAPELLGEDYVNDADATEWVDPCVDMNPTDMFLTLEKYSGVYQQRRRYNLYLISNFINEFPEPVSRFGGAGSPLYAMFSGQWRACDTVNQSFKYRRMLYHGHVERHCRDDQIRFDFVLTCALQATHVLTAKLAGKCTNGHNGEQYHWQQFGVHASKMLFDLYLSMGADKDLKV